MNPAQWRSSAKRDGLSLGVYVALHFDEILDHGVEPDAIVAALEPRSVVSRYDALVKAGAHIDLPSFVKKLEPYDIAYSIKTIRAAGIEVGEDDLAWLVDQLAPEDVADFAVDLVEAGASIDAEELVRRLSPFDQLLALQELNSIGANVDVATLLPNLTRREVGLCADELRAPGLM